MLRALIATTALASALLASSVAAQQADAPGLELLYTSHITLGEVIEVGPTARRASAGTTPRVIPGTVRSRPADAQG